MTPNETTTCCRSDEETSSDSRFRGGRRRKLGAAVALWPIGVYRKFLSPLKRMPSCRYLPTCSEYAEIAIRKRGVVMGTLLAMWRLLRCNPLFGGGYDPVPSPGEKVHAGPR